MQIPLDNIHLDAYTRLVIMEDQVELNEQSQAKSANKRTHLTESELQELLEVARKADVRAWAMFALAFNHGLRVSEVTALRLTSFNWKDRTVTVARLKGSMTTTQSLVDLRGNPTMSDTAALKEYLKVRIEDGSGLLFVGQKGPMQRWTLTRMFRAYCEKVSAARVSRGLEPIAENAMHFHALKHSCATILASKVSNIFTVKNYLGHASISSTMVYCAPDMKSACIEAKEVFTQAFSIL